MIFIALRWTASKRSIWDLVKVGCHSDEAYWFGLVPEFPSVLDTQLIRWQEGRTASKQTFIPKGSLLSNWRTKVWGTTGQPSFVWRTGHRASTSTRWHFAFVAMLSSAPIANPPNSAQLEGTRTIPPSYIRVRAVVWEGGEGQTDKQTHRRPWLLYISRLRLTRNVMTVFRPENSPVCRVVLYAKKNHFKCNRLRRYTTIFVVYLFSRINN